MDNIVTINNMSFSRPDHQIFDKVSLTIPRGKITAIMGPSGTGKTTLLRLIGGQLIPEAGTVDFEGQNVHALSRKELYTLRRRMGVLFQSGALFTNLSVFDNVAFPLREHTNLSERMIRDLVLLKLESVGLRGARHLMPSELSGGMSRRVALARTMALDPELMMYDEPFTGQDPISMAVLVKLIKKMHDVLGLTSVIVSHDVPETAAISDYIYLISETKIIAHGAPDELLKQDSPEVNQFMKGLPDGPVPFNYPSRPLTEDLFSTDRES